MHTNLGSLNKTEYILYGILHLLTKLVDQDRKIFSSMNPRQELTHVLHLYVTTSIKQNIFLFD